MIKKNAYLIIKTSALGDIVHSYPVLDYLQEKDPHCVIDWVVEESNSTLVSAHPAIRNTITVNTKKWRKNPLSTVTYKEIGKTIKKLREEKYELIIDLQGNIKSGLISLLASSKKKVGYSFSAAPEWPNALFHSTRLTPPPKQNIREDYLYLVKSAFSDHEPFQGKPTVLTLTREEELLLTPFKELQQPSILLAPFSRWPNKEFSKDLSIAIVKLLSEHGMMTYISYGSIKEEELALEIVSHFPKNAKLLPKMTLPQLSHVMRLLGATISADSLPLHLAAAVGAKTFSLFGPSLSGKYAPTGFFHESIQGSCPYKYTFEKRCEKLRTCKTGACIKDLKIDEVLTELAIWVETV